MNLQDFDLDQSLGGLNMLKSDTGQVVIFFVLSFAISWSLFLLGYEGTEHVLGYVAKFGFTISAIIVMILAKEKSMLKEIGQNFMNLRQARHLWIGLIPIGFYIIAAIISADHGTFILRDNFKLSQFLFVLLLAPSSGIIFYMFLRGGLGEEVGLRAFAVPKLMKRFSPMKSSFVIGVIWALWHYIVWWEQGAVNLIVLSVAVIAWSMVYTFVYIKTGSIWTMILLHAVGNAFDDVLEWLYPNLAHVDWEIPYIICVIAWGVISLVLLLRMKRNLNLDAKPKE